MQSNFIHANISTALTGCKTRLDRAGMVAPQFGRLVLREVPTIAGFRVVDDKWIPKQGKVRTYLRVRSFENVATGTTVYMQYKPARGWLKPFRLVVVGNDQTGIPFVDLYRISAAFHGNLGFNMAEWSFDFDPATGVDRDYVLKHALFGKSRPKPNPKFPDMLYYGSRYSHRFVRAYWKKEIGSFRVELEMHPGRFQPDLETLYTLYLFNLQEDDFRLVDMDWAALNLYLGKRGSAGRRIATEARKQYQSLHGLLTYLRSEHVNNPNRFLRKSPRNGLIGAAFEAWCGSMDWHQYQ